MPPFDSGLQAERTELAWRRTALAIGVGSLVAMRMLPAALGNALWALCGGAGMIAAAVLWVAARRRSSAVNNALAVEGERAALPPAGILAVLAMLVTALSIVGLVAVVAIAIFGVDVATVGDVIESHLPPLEAALREHAAE